jgi:uncharacterized membrane protein YqiK
MKTNSKPSHILISALMLMAIGLIVNWFFNPSDTINADNITPLQLLGALTSIAGGAAFFYGLILGGWAFLYVVWDERKKKREKNTS